MQNERNDSNSWERTGLLGAASSAAFDAAAPPHQRCPQPCLLPSRLRLPFCLPQTPATDRSAANQANLNVERLIRRYLLLPSPG
jgi:hypothetical protein